MKKKIIRQFFSAILCITMGMVLLPTTNTRLNSKEVICAKTTLSNPRIVKDRTMKSGQVVTYDCVWFGSYPQAEVIPSIKDYSEIASDYLQEGDLIEDKILYEKLQSLTGWDENGDIEYEGNKYRRLKQSDATRISPIETDFTDYYHWSDDVGYHFFKFEPIKWRILSVEGNEAFLLSDKGLTDIVYDEYDYYETDHSVTWETCTLRKWLNNDFMNSAFSSSEQQAILIENLENADCSYWNNNVIEGGNNTSDSIFLLSESDTLLDTEAVTKYGFVNEYHRDEAKKFHCSTYSRAMGIMWNIQEDRKGNPDAIWLRTPGSTTDQVTYLTPYGSGRGCCSAWTYVNTVIPALKLNLTHTKLYHYAGTMSTNGNVNEIEPLTTIKLTTQNTSIKLSKTSYIYNGKNKKPSVKVFNSEGKVLNKKYYTVTYKNNKKVGKATATIKFKGKYTGTIKATYTIKPKGTKFSNKIKKKNQITLLWKKQTAQTTGYQIQYATDPKYSQNKKMLTITKAKQTSNTIKNLKSNVKYYFRIRSYKTVNGKKYYSNWSKSLAITAK